MLNHPRDFFCAAPIVGVLALAGCGGAQAPANCPTNETPASTAAAPPATPPKEPASNPPPFVGTFELQRGTDGTNTVDFTQMIQSNALDGRVLWRFGGNEFSLEVWVLGNHKDPARPDEEILSLCRGSATVPARFEGATAVLPGGLEVKGFSTAVFVQRKRDDAAGKTTTRTWTKDNGCSANLAAKRVTFEVVEKDAEGPVRLRATADGGTFELQRATPVDKLDVKAILQAVGKR